MEAELKGRGGIEVIGVLDRVLEGGIAVLAESSESAGSPYVN
jgi:hypothetical protein